MSLSAMPESVATGEEATVTYHRESGECVQMIERIDVRGNRELYGE